jgi:DNA polymerase-4
MILFLFVPGFYASVEQADHPQLRGRPILVGGDPHKRGTVTSASVEAASKGVTEGMRMAEGLELCPEAQVRPTRLRRYREVASALRALAWSHTDRVEPDGLSAVYFEVPDEQPGLTVAAELCVRVRADLGLPVGAGIGPTRFVAYAAAQHCGPSGIRRVEREEAHAFLAGLPVTLIWGLGPATAERLAERGIRLIGELQALSLEELEGIVGRPAPSFQRLALGKDDDRIRARPRPKSISQEETLAEPTSDLGTLGERLGELSARIAQVLEREGRAARTVGVGLELIDEQQLTRSQTEGRPLATAAEIRDAVYALLGRARPGSHPVRRIRVQVTNLCPRGQAREPRQLSLF